MGFLSRLFFGAAPQGQVDSFAKVGKLKGIDGEDFPMDTIDGKVVLFVNVASKCGLTGQYTQLVQLQKTYEDQDFTIIGVPCNQFLGQEPGNAEQIQEVCRSFSMKSNGNEFPMLEKQNVNGKERSLLYQYLVESKVGGNSDIGWNFEKFLVGKDKQVVARFGPRTVPDDKKVVEAIDKALA